MKIPSQLKAVKIDAHSQSFEILGLNDSTLRNLADDCPNLERIKIIDYNPKKLNDFTSLSMSIVTSHWPHLQSLNLSSFSENGIRSINDIDIMSASFVCKNLKGITLDSFKNMTDASISELVTNCQHLEKVSLAFTYITDDSLTSLSTLSNLKHLTLRGCRKLSERGFCELFESTGQLTHLNISTASGITDMSFSKLCSSCVKLETLIINDADVTDDSIYHLPDLINLKNLVLSNCKGVEASEPFRELAKLKNLKELSLAGNKLLLNEDLSFVIGVIGKSLMKLRLDGCVLLDIHFLQILCTNSPMMR